MGPRQDSCAPAPALTDEEFQLLRALIHREAGISLKETKRSLVMGRLAACLRRTGASTYREYYDLLHLRDPHGSERRRMINAITTNKTAFFREQHHFEYLEEWLSNRAKSSTLPRTLRVWSAACSTGEEPYSIAISACEALRPFSAWDVRILASDIDTDVLADAEAGVYPLDSLGEIAEHIKRKYFQRGTGGWEGHARIKTEIRRLVEFRRVNLIEEPWPIQARFDAIFCRNVIIYFDRATQKRLFDRLLHYLRPDGLLFVGHSESLQAIAAAVRPIGHAIYSFRAPAEAH